MGLVFLNERFTELRLHLAGSDPFKEVGETGPVSPLRVARRDTIQYQLDELFFLQRTIRAIQQHEFIQKAPLSAAPLQSHGRRGFGQIQETTALVRSGAAHAIDCGAEAVPTSAGTSVCERSHDTLGRE